MNEYEGFADRDEPSQPGVLPAGTLVAGRFRVERVLGEGASGIVYRSLVENVGPVEDDTALTLLKPGDRVALKIIHRHLVRDPQVSRRFRREARLLRRLRGDHLARFLDFGEAEKDRLYIALELAPGSPLDELMKEGKVDRHLAVEIACQACQALEVAHAAGVVHRDLKPGNVLVELDQDGRPHVMVVDFGLAKILTPEPGQSLTALTERNMVFGTPEYMAPEQARGDEIDSRVDLYSLGVMLYELLTGRLPFESNTPIGLLTKHLSEPPPPPSSQNSARPVSPALEAVIMHALAKHPEQRYSSASAFAAALRAAVERPDDAQGVAPSAPSVDFVSRDTALDLAEQHSLKDLSAMASPTHSVEDETKLSPLWIVLGVVAVLLGLLLGVYFSL